MNLFIRCVFASLLCICNMQSFAGTSPHPWSITASLGLNHYSGMTDKQGQTALGRLAFGNHLFMLDSTQISIELGLQNGNQMRLHLPKETIDNLGGVPINVMVQPALDALITFKTPLPTALPLITIVKGGFTYRQLHTDRTEVPDIAELNPEIQIGLGFCIHHQLTASLVYQRIFGGKTHFRADTENMLGTIAHIPSQDAVLFGLTVIL